MLSLEKMKEKLLEKKYYITRYYDWQDGVKIPVYELSHDTNNGYNGGVIITKERAMQWLEAGAELFEL